MGKIKSNLEVTEELLKDISNEICYIFNNPEETKLVRNKFGCVDLNHLNNIVRNRIKNKKLSINHIVMACETHLNNRVSISNNKLKFDM